MFRAIWNKQARHKKRIYSIKFQFEMKKFSYKDIDFQDIKQLIFTVQYWLYKIERLNRHGQMSIEFKKESATDWRKLGLGAMREQILEETIELLNLGLRLDMQKTKRPHSFQKLTFQTLAAKNFSTTPLFYVP
jgi:hypothetical protein